MARNHHLENVTRTGSGGFGHIPQWNGPRSVGGTESIRIEGVDSLRIEYSIIPDRIEAESSPQLLLVEIFCKEVVAEHLRVPIVKLEEAE